MTVIKRRIREVELNTFYYLFWCLDFCESQMFSRLDLSVEVERRVKWQGWHIFTEYPMNSDTSFSDAWRRLQ